MSTITPSPPSADGPATDGPTTAMTRQLEPVRQALLADARVQAEQILHDAHIAADRVVQQATADADAQVVRERRRGELVAQAEAAAELARAANDARGRVLGRQQAARDELLQQVRRAALGLRDEPGYPQILDRLAAMAASQLGDEAEIQRDPDGTGGVVGVAAGRRVDYTLTAVADRAVTAIVDEAVTLWT